MTRAQSIGIDGHFLVEQSARNWNGLFMNFNGTAGVWRRDAIRAGGSSLRDHRRADGSLGDFQHNFQVYGRDGLPCYRCDTAIERLASGSRSVFICPTCQPR